MAMTGGERMGARVARWWRRAGRVLRALGALLVEAFVGVFYLIGLVPSLAVAAVRLGWADGKRGGRGRD